MFDDLTQELAPALRQITDFCRRSPNFFGCYLRKSHRSFSGYVTCVLIASDCRDKAVAAIGYQFFGDSQTYLCVRDTEDAAIVSVSVPCQQPTTDAPEIGFANEKYISYQQSQQSQKTLTGLFTDSGIGKVAVIGSRKAGFATKVTPQIGQILSLIADKTVLTGDAHGVDAVVRRVLGGIASARLSGNVDYQDGTLSVENLVIYAQRSGHWGRNKPSFALRTMAVINDADMVVAFPDDLIYIQPSAESRKCFNGSGRGTNAAIALAVGKGKPTLVYYQGILPDGYDDFVEILPNWHFCG